MQSNSTFPLSVQALLAVLSSPLSFRSYLALPLSIHVTSSAPASPLHPTPSLWLPPTLRSRSPTLHPLRLRPIDVMRRDPTLIVGLRTRRNSRTIRSQDAHLVRRINLLGAASGALSTVAAFASTRFLREEGGDPGVVDEVACSGKDGQEEEVKEDA